MHFHHCKQFQEDLEMLKWEERWKIMFNNTKQKFSKSPFSNSNT